MSTIASIALTLGGGVPTAGAAQTYYVSPDGTGSSCSQAAPCFITAGIGGFGPGTDVEIAPGDYMVGTQQLSSLNGPANIHGVAGQPRPRIFSDYAFSAWQLGNTNGDFTVKHLELYTTGPVGISVNGTGVSTVDDVIISATGGSGNGCSPAVRNGGSVTFTNSICRGVNSGLGITCACGGLGTVTLRNVTAVGDTYGVSFSSPIGGSPATDYAVNATNVIARHTGMTGADVRAEGGTNGADVAVNLANSNYASQQEDASGGGTATVTDPGTGTGNQTAAPSFVNAVAGDFHQLPTSPTVGAGVNDMLNGTADIDGQQRQIDTVDIGADELGRPTSTALSCTPTAVVRGTPVTCTATVTDTGSGGPSTPTGLVSFASGGPGSFASPTCTLAAGMTAGQASCSATYTPAQAGAHQITANSARDLLHEGSQGTAAVTASNPPVTSQSTQKKKKKCKKKKRRSAAAAKKKCKKRR